MGGTESLQDRHPVAAPPAEVYRERCDRVRAGMREQGIDALLITSPENVYYLAGLNHQGYFAFTMLIFPQEGKPSLVTRSMERITVVRQAPDVTSVGFEDGEKPAAAVLRALRDMGLTTKRLGAEKGGMFFPPQIFEEMQNGLPEVQWVAVPPIVEDLRLIKSSLEIDYIRRAAEISSDAMTAAIETAAAGVNEQDIAAAAYQVLITEGSEPPGFTPLIRSTETLAQEHTTWRNYVLQSGDGLFVELSASVLRYHAPLLRTVYMDSASDDIRRAKDAAYAGLMTVQEELRPGVISGDVYAAWERVVRQGIGRNDYRRHHCGYTVGIGFPPSWAGGSIVQGIKRNGTLEIREGMVFHVLSWITDEALAFYSVSDTMLVTSNGAEMLTTAPRDIITR